MLYHIPANFSFLDSLATHILDKYDNGEKNALSEIYVFLPSRRAVHSLKEKLLQHSHKKAIILPRICPIGDIGTEEFSIYSLGLAENINLPNVLSKLQQKILFTKLILDRVHNGHIKVSDSMLSDIGYNHLATELIALFSDLQKAKIDTKILESLIKDETNDFALHWQYISQFLQLIVEWPSVLKEKNLADPIEYRNLVVSELINYWQINPPKFPVIAAGSTASTKATLKLLKAIDSLPEGQVIIPSLDLDMEEDTWKVIDELHPQYNLKNLLGYLGYQRSEVNLWPGCIEKYRYTNDDRIKLISSIMRPYSATNSWHTLTHTIFDAQVIENMQYVVCDNLYQEANIIALIMRQTLETPTKTVSLVTNDNALTQLVIANLAKWNIAIHNSFGKKLKDTPASVYLRLVLDVINTNFQIVPLLALLKHHFTLLEYDEKIFNKLVIQFELKILRDMRVKPGLEGLIEAIEQNGDQELYEFITKLRSCTSKFINLYTKQKLSFTELLDEHILLIEKLTKRNNYNIWEEADGVELAQFLLELREYAPELGIIEPNAYTEILCGFLQEHLYFPDNHYNHRLTILTPIEARFHDTDLLVLGGLNEGCWPELPQKSPFLNKHMRQRIGLPLIEQKIGQAAHDFFTLCGAKEVVLTRSRKLQSNQTIASRFLLRLEAVLTKLNLLNTIQNTPYLNWYKLLNTVTQPNTILPPDPKPPKEFRPKKLSVTQIELLMQDPYSIYAKHILKLRPLEELNAIKAADFGNFVHRTIEYFSALKLTDSNEEYIYQELLKCGQIIIQEYITHLATYYLWWPRFERIAKWFAMQERYCLIEEKMAIFSEVMGKIIIQLDLNDQFILTAKADRIEIDENNNINIVDYKTGYIPEKNNVRKGYNPQLPLEGLIASNRGFSCQNTSNNYYITNLTYIDLSGSERVGKIVNFTSEVDMLIKQTEIKMKNLITTFNDPTTPYLSCPLSSRAPRYNQYTHLARSKEWK